MVGTNDLAALELTKPVQARIPPDLAAGLPRANFDRMKHPTYGEAKR